MGYLLKDGTGTLGSLHTTATLPTTQQVTINDHQIVMRKTSTSRKQALRDCVQQAYEEELSRALSLLAGSFDAWRSGMIDSEELNRIIHKFHQQTAREITVRYDMGDQRALVANAIASGILDRQQLPSELIADMEQLIAYFEAATSKEQLAFMKKVSPSARTCM